MTGPEAVVAGAALTAAASLIVWSLGTLVSRLKEARDRRRETFSRAFEAVAHYKEFPYVVRRRRPSDPEGERIRISDEFRGVQQRISYFSAWLTTESPHAAAAYNSLVKEVRQVAGGAVHDAWLTDPVDDDADMNMPDLGLGKLNTAEQAYLSAVRDELHFWPRWMRRVRLFRA